ncbi:hypothetical protein [Ornithinimicrobium sp. CNJ-824]|uniref:hypothetical protein n=1 Tax=Ornithinimicrobium sp. CNJ-824 TaxID=1904966 RepID=UPI00117F16EA|nr:hypothetical protein [Ornithinimicrobium sp. CNJ-824]
MHGAPQPVGGGPHRGGQLVERRPELVAGPLQRARGSPRRAAGTLGARVGVPGEVGVTPCLLGELAEPPLVAELRAVPQRRQPRLVGGHPGLRGGERRAGLLLTLLDPRQRLLRPLDRGPQPRLLLDHGDDGPAPGGEDGPGVVGVRLRERGERRGRGGATVDLLAEGGELVEGVGGRTDRLLVQLGQRLGQLLGEPGGLDVLPDLRLAQPVEQAQHLVVASRVEAEEDPPDVGLVVGCAVEDVVGTQHLAQPGVGERARGVLEQEVVPEALVGGEVPRGRGPSAGGGADADAAGEVLLVAVGGGAGELDPDVAHPVAGLDAVGHQPQQARVVLGRGGEPGLVAVECEGQQHLQRLGLAGAVGPAQQQPAVGEGEDLLVVLPDVEDARAGQPEAGRGGVAGRGRGAAGQGKGHASSSKSDRSPAGPAVVTSSGRGA